VPCDAQEDAHCPYDPSPGFDGHLDWRNRSAVWFFERWQVIGERAWDLLPPLSESQRYLLTEQLACLAHLVATHNRAPDERA
jgi:hypothetical protein